MVYRWWVVIPPCGDLGEVQGQQVAEELDIVTDLVYPLPVIMIAGLLGLRARAKAASASRDLD
ncbi:MAG: hypothetical protein ACRD0K_00110 [Egibacteraceae bacterium]